MPTLYETHKLLVELVISKFPKLRNKQPRKRNVKHTLVSDIHILGCAATNKVHDTDLEKIFTDQTSSTRTIDTSQDLAEVIQKVTEMSIRFEAIEREIANIKYENSNLPQIIKNLQPYSDTETSDKRSKLISNRQSSKTKDGIISNRQQSDTKVLVSNRFELLEEEAERESDSGAETNSYIRRQDNYSPSRKREKRMMLKSHRVKAAKSSLVNADESTEIYIGGVDKNTKNDAIMDELATMGIDRQKCHVKTFQQSGDAIVRGIHTQEPIKCCL